MGSVKYPWWSYVQSMIRKYPERMRRYEKLNRVEQMEVDAVRAAMRATKATDCGLERLRLVGRYYWGYGKKTVSGVAMDLYISRATAFRWLGDFICQVAQSFGIYDPE